MTVRPESWLRVLPEGLYCAPGDFFIDPVRPVDRAVVTHGHGDHARRGNRRVLATPGTLAIMAARFDAAEIGETQPLDYRTPLMGGDVRVALHPAGHGALAALCTLYEQQGVALGPLLPATGAIKDALKGQIVLAPPGATNDRWARRLPDPVVALASGWMRVRQRARQRGVELPLILSDHADWDELNATIDDVGAPEVWVTHGREEALVHHAQQRGIRARALALLGFAE